MKIIRTPQAMQKWSALQKRAGHKIAFVPTMGYLHAGHISLVHKARSHGDKTIVSIFVNPIQFNNREDLEKYPRDEKRDLAMLRKAGVDAVFLPTAKDMYPEGFATRVQVSGLTKGLCGASRPGHFDGVTTVVLKLFAMTQPDVACFGRKDYQQYLVVSKMVTDLSLPVKIIGVETMREKDGLAMSSRNVRLAPRARQLALGISAGLMMTARSCEKRRLTSDKMKSVFLSCLSRDKTVRLDYVETLDAETLLPLKKHKKGRTLMAVAVWIDGVRLIDNKVF